MEKINNIGLSRELSSCYDFHGFTEQEVWARIAQKINIIIEHFNYIDKKVDNEKENNKTKFDYLLGEGLSEQVAKALLNKISDGTIGELINGSLLKDINNKVDDFTTETNKTINTFTNEFTSQLNANISEMKINYARKSELEIERNRIDLLTKISNGETEGNTELLDIRNGADGNVYDSSGEAVRTQFKNINNILVPENYPDFSRLITKGDEAGTDKEISATFDSILIKQIASNTGNGGFTTEIDYNKYKKLSFDVSYQGMGIACGLYYFKDSKLLRGYKTYTDIPKINIVARKLVFNIDIEEIKNGFNVYDANKIMFIVWNGTNPTIGGTIHITNISFDDYIIPINMKNYVNTKLSNIGYDSISGLSGIIGDTQSLQVWGSNVDWSISDNIIHYIYSDTSGNNGLMTPSFKPNHNFIKVKINIIELTKGGLHLYVKGKNNSGNDVYLGVKQIKEVGSIDEIIDLNYFVVYRDLNLNEPIHVLIANIEETDIKFTDFLAYENSLTGYEIVGDTLTDTLRNISNKLSEISSDIPQQNSNVLISPNGGKFLLNVLDDGTLTTIPYIPNKTLFIGNSLLLGHGTFGMCATDSKNDYYYHVSNYIKTLNSSATFEKLQGSGFEGCISQSEVNTWITSNLENKSLDYNLIYVQLGDNVNTSDRTNNFKTSCEYLLKYLRNKFKNARIYWVGMWYGTDEKQSIIENACTKTGCGFINIRPLYTPENQGKIGDTITSDTGEQWQVTSTGVASHPNNIGNKKIADLMIEKSF